MISLSAPLAGTSKIKNLRQQFQGGIPCIPKPKRKYKYEKERIKQFSIWFEEVDKDRQKEYTKRRHERVQKEQSLLQHVGRIRYLFIPVVFCLIAGTIVLIFSNMKSVGNGTIFFKYQEKFSILGAVLVSSGSVLLLVTEGIISHIKHKHEKLENEHMKCDCAEKAKKELDQKPSRLNIQRISKTEDNHTSSNKINESSKLIRTSQEREARDSDNGISLRREKIDSTASSDTLNDSERRRPPKMSVIKAKKQGFQILESVDSSTSGATEYSYLESSNTSSVFSHLPTDIVEGACGTATDIMPSTSGANVTYTRAVYELPYLERLTSEESLNSDLSF